MPPAMAEMQNQLDRLGWDVACINSNQPDGGIARHLVAKRGDQEIRVNGPDVHEVWWHACEQAASMEHDEYWIPSVCRGNDVRSVRRFLLSLKRSPNPGPAHAEVLAHLVVAAVFKTVARRVNRVVGGFDSHALPPFYCAERKPSQALRPPTLTRSSRSPACTPACISDGPEPPRHTRPVAIRSHFACCQDRLASTRTNSDGDKRCQRREHPPDGATATLGCPPAAPPVPRYPSSIGQLWRGQAGNASRRTRCTSPGKRYTARAPRTLAARIWSVRCVEASRPAKCVMRENGKGEKGRNSRGPVDSLRLLVFHFPLLPLFPITLPLQATRKLNSGLQTSNLELLNFAILASLR